MTTSQMQNFGSWLLFISAVFMAVTVATFIIALCTNPHSIILNLLSGASFFISGCAFCFAVICGIDIDNKRAKGEE